MSDRRGQATTIVVGAIILSLLLSMLVGGGLSLDGTTNDLNLNEVSNNGDYDVPSISYAAVCFVGEVGEEYGLDTVDITFSNEGEPGEYFTVSYTSDYGPDFIIVKGGQRMEMFPPRAGPYTFGTGELVDPAYDNDAPCGPNAFGVRVNVDTGDKELVGDAPVFVAES
ncbi:MAG: hypothetical protein R3324_20075 [Halobacteriales archaeon]|nr:hypothetical protein [Halobacteriales archaeon]